MGIRRVPWGRPAFILAVGLFLCLLIPSPGAAQCSDCDGDGFTFPTDCNDAAPLVYPGQTEICNGLDDDCDGDIDEAPGCLASCPFPDAQGPPLEMPTSNTSNAQGQRKTLVWDGTQLALADGRDFNESIRLSRLTEDGQLLGDTTMGTYSHRPSMVWTGEAFAVAWRDRDPVDSHYRLMLAQVAPDGTFLLPPTAWRDCGTDYNDCASPRLAWNGERFGILWQSKSHSLWFTALDRSGAELPGTTVKVSDSVVIDSWETVSDIAAKPGEFAAVFRRNGVIFRRISPDGVLLGSETQVSQPGEDARVVAAGDRWGVAFRRRRYLPAGGFHDGPYLAVLDATGTIMQGPTEGVAPFAVYGYLTPVELAWTGAEFGVAWSAREEEWSPVVTLSFISRFDADGSLLATQRVALKRAHAVSPVVAWTGDRYAMAWHTESEKVQIGALRCDCDLDPDGDGSSSCGDCDEGNPTAMSYGRICDGLANNCYAGGFPDLVDTEESDDDGDGFTECAGDCQEWRGTTIYPGAPQVCDDGRNNDCNHPTWPDLVGTNEVDDDGDLFTECEGDCDDTEEDLWPRAPMLCDGLNNDCDDPDWPSLTGTEEEPGGICETTGGQMPVITLAIDAAGVLSWQADITFSSWNVYRGNVAGFVCSALEVCGYWGCRDACRPAGGWRQEPGGDPLVARTCGVTSSSLADAVSLDQGHVAFFVVTAVPPSGTDGALGIWEDLTDMFGGRYGGSPCP